MYINKKHRWAINFYNERNKDTIYIVPTIMVEPTRDADLVLLHLTFLFLIYQQTLTLSKQL